MTQTQQPEALRFTKKPVTIVASQWFKSGDHPAVRDISDSDDLFFTGMGGSTIVDREKFGVIGTLESPNHLVTPGDWIITGVKGEHYPCKPDIFEATYAPHPAALTLVASSQPAPDEIINMAREQGLPETEIEGVFRVNADDLCRVAAAILVARAPADRVTAPQQEAQEPVMIYHGDCTIDCGEHGQHHVELLRMIPAGSKLYAAPQPSPASQGDAARRFFDAGWKACANFCDRDDVRFDGIVGHRGCPQFEEAFREARKQGGV